MKRRSFLSWLLAAPAMPSVAAVLPLPPPPVVPQAAAAIAPVVAAAPQLAALDEIEIRGWVDHRFQKRYLDDAFDPWIHKPRISGQFTFDARQPELWRAHLSGQLHSFVVHQYIHRGLTFRFRAHINTMTVEYPVQGGYRETYYLELSGDAQESRT